mgnify:CR=1 FL=1
MRKLILKASAALSPLKQAAGEKPRFRNTQAVRAGRAFGKTQMARDYIRTNTMTYVFA